MTKDVRISIRFLIIQACTLILLACFVSLGLWQLSRGDVKHEIEALIVDDDQDYSTVSLPLQDYRKWRYKRIGLHGRFLSDRQFLLDNQIRDRQAGYSVLTPFLVQAANVWVLVDRGWIAQGAERDIFPSVPVDSEPGYITASIYVPYGKPFSLGQIAEGEDYGWPRRIQFVDYAELSNRLGVELQAFTLRLDPQEKSGYRRD